MLLLLHVIMEEAAIALLQRVVLREIMVHRALQGLVVEYVEGKK